jgi:beta-lactamase class A
MDTETLDERASPIIGDAFHLDRRDFLGALAATSAGLLLGAPSFAAAGPRRGSLQGQVVDLVQRLRREGAISAEERTSWCVYDFSAKKKLVSINEDSPRQAASMIKPFVAQAYFFLAEDSPRKVRYTSDVRSTMERMIRKSSNTATNEIIDLVSRYRSHKGPKDVEAVLKGQAPKIFQQTRIVEKIPAGGKTYRNLASAHDYSRFLWALWNDRLPYSQELRSIMALPNHDRISKGVASMPERVRVYDKTGSTAQLCGNMGIIEAQDARGRRYPYTFVGIIERPNSTRSYGSWITRRSNAIRTVSNLVYLDMRERYRLV